MHRKDPKTALACFSDKWKRASGQGCRVSGRNAFCKVLHQTLRILDSTVLLLTLCHACSWLEVGIVQEEINSRQEAHTKLAEQRKEAERERKALREELEGKLRAARKEIADLRNLSKVLQLPQSSLPHCMSTCPLQDSATNNHDSDDVASYQSLHECGIANKVMMALLSESSTRNEKVFEVH